MLVRRAHEGILAHSLFLKKIGGFHRQRVLLVLFKNPNRTDPKRIIQIVVVHVAIVEIHVPRVISIVLGRTPIVSGRRATKIIYKGVIVKTRLPALMLFYCDTFTQYRSPFIAFKQKLARLLPP